MSDGKTHNPPLDDGANMTAKAKPSCGVCGYECGWGRPKYCSEECMEVANTMRRLLRNFRRQRRVMDGRSLDRAEKWATGKIEKTFELAREAKLRHAAKARQ